MVLPVDRAMRSEIRGHVWVVYNVTADGKLIEDWHSDAPAAQRYFLADGGKSVACIQLIPPGKFMAGDMLLAVFREGKLVRGFTAGALIKNPMQLQVGSHGYQWLKTEFDGEMRIVMGQVLLFETLEGTKFKCDLETGELTENPN